MAHVWMSWIKSCATTFWPQSKTEVIAGDDSDGFTRKVMMAKKYPPIQDKTIATTANGSGQATSTSVHCSTLLL